MNPNFPDGLLEPRHTHTGALFYALCIVVFGPPRLSTEPSAKPPRWSVGAFGEPTCGGKDAREQGS